MTDREFIVLLAIGRIVRLLSRPTQPGDDADYHRCRALILDNSEPVEDRSPNWARDRLKGAQGDS